MFSYRFLLAQLHVDTLASAAALSIRHVRNKLQTLPITLDGTYDEAMQRIQNEDADRRDVALKTLAWVSYAFRSLSLKELQHAVAINPGDTELDKELIMDGSSITAVCAGLVIVDQRTSVVTLVHYTAKNYFEQIKSETFPNFHASITMSCATYLTLDALKDASIWDILRTFPLAGYAAQYMADHARQNPEEALEPTILETICNLLSHPGKRKPLLALLDSLDMINSGFYSSSEVEHSSIGEKTVNEAAGVQLETLLEHMVEFADDTSQTPMEVSESEESESETPAVATRIPEVTALHLAASMGLAKVAAMLLQETPNIDAVDETGNTALAMAMERGFEKAVEFLVMSGACVDLRHDHGRDVFVHIIERDWTTVAESISHKATSAIEEDESAPVQLLVAAYSGDNEEALQVTRQEKMDLHKEDRVVAASALFIAVERCQLQVVEILLSAGVDVDARDSAGQTSLHRATRRKNAAMMRLLLNNGATVDAKNDGGRTAFSANVRTCDESCIKVLLDAGADPNTVGHDGVSELYEAAAKGEVEYVRTLLKSGTNPSITTKYGWAPLHWASSSGHIEVVQVLIQAKADLSPISDQESTPLDMALRANQFAIVDLLMRAGAKGSRVLLTAEDATTPVQAHFSKNASAIPIDIYNVVDEKVMVDSHVPDKLSLVFDKPLGQSLLFGQFAYASNSPGATGYTYHISHPLDTATSSIRIRGTKRRANMVDYPIGPEKFIATNVLYRVERTTLDYQELELRALTQNTPHACVKMQRGWTGSWKVCDDHIGHSNILYRTTPDWSTAYDGGSRWITDDGKLLARSGFDIVTSGFGGAIPTLTFEPGLQKPMQDFLVACWIAKLWFETVTLQKPKA